MPTLLHELVSSGNLLENANRAKPWNAIKSYYMPGALLFAIFKAWNGAGFSMRSVYNTVRAYG
jgi:hypothetical protein